MKGDGFVYVEPAENDQCEPCILLKNFDNINEFINKSEHSGDKIIYKESFFEMVFFNNYTSTIEILKEIGVYNEGD